MEERRGRPAEIVPQESPRKYTKIYDREDVTETWIYDLDKHPNGPISVDIKYKNGADKNWAKMQKEQKRYASSMRKINKAQALKTNK
jgi:hypothetical protein